VEGWIGRARYLLKVGNRTKRVVLKQKGQEWGSRANAYLESVRSCLKLDPAAKRIVLKELRAHVEDKFDELRRQGVPEEVAGERAVRSLGSPRVVAQQLIDLYSQGTWKQAIFAALPHGIVAWLLAVRAWQGDSWYSFILIGAAILFAIGTVLYGWWLGKPTWLFPWLGYYMLPVIAAGILVVSLPTGWGWIAGVVYIPLAVAALFYIIRQTLREDWLLASFMLLPVPIVVFWVLAIGLTTTPEWIPWRLSEASTAIGLSFVTLAVISATFVRVRQRRVKIAALIAPELGLLVFLGLTSGASMGFIGWMLLAVGSFALLVSPAWFEGHIK
jgi:hypothetical protein